MPPRLRETRQTIHGGSELGIRGEVTRRVLATAARQHGAISLAQLVPCGLSAAGVRHRVAAGLLHRVHRGVYAVGRADLAPRGHWMAAVLACGEGAVLSHLQAAALHGIRQTAAARIHVTIPRRSTLARDRIHVHNHPELAPEDVTEVDRIPVTSVARTLLDLAAILREQQLERACDKAVILEVFDLREVQGLLRRSRGRRGVRRLRNVLARGDLGENVPASGLEIRYRDLCEAAGLPRPEINRYLLLGDEYHKVDFLWRRQRVVIETDGARYHSTGWQRARDEHRDRLLARHGYRSSRIADDDIRRFPGDAVAAARALLAQGR
jgi:Transcriptional regulator, AbiEi antitoxin/Protein of unknown function (DUF559)